MVTGTGTSADEVRTTSPTATITNDQEISATALWWAAFPVGTACIASASWLGALLGDWAFFAVGLAMPVVVMMIYSYLGLTRIYNSSRRSQFADSIYYLGFIFTLVTLAISLVYLATTKESWEAISLGQLIGRFGLALATTIFGLAVRVAVVNLTANEESLKEDAEVALARTVDNFRLQLENSIDAFKGLSDTYIKTLEEAAMLSAETLKDITRKTGEEIEGAVGEVATALGSSAKSYTETFDEKTKNIKFPDELISEKFEDPMEKITNNLERMAAATKEVVKTQTSLAKKTSEVAERYADADKHVASIENVSARIADIVKAIDQLGSGLEGFIEKIEESADSAASGLTRLSGSIGQLETSVKGVSEEIRGVGELAKIVRHQSAIATEHQKELESSLSKSRDAMTVVQQEMVTAAKTVVEKLQG